MDLSIRLGDLVKMVGWFNNKPVISIVGKKEASIRFKMPHSPFTVLINESQFIECMHQIGLNLQYLFFYDIPASKIGVFIERSPPHLKLDLKELARKILEILMKINPEFETNSTSDVPIQVYFVAKDAFTNWAVYKADAIGTKSTNQIKLPRVALNDDTVEYFKSKVLN